jgi:hypothetical protein
VCSVRLEKGCKLRFASTRNCGEAELSRLVTLLWYFLRRTVRLASLHSTVYTEMRDVAVPVGRCEYIRLCFRRFNI